VTLLAIEDVHQQFGALKVLNGISLAVPRGQALGVVGPNGAGKTTLIDIVAGGDGRAGAVSASPATMSRAPRRVTGPGWGWGAPTRCRGPSPR
jgi:branched-chain amino acid transport system ATP-binding protein